jgi:hypothetical protein
MSDVKVTVNESSENVNISITESGDVFNITVQDNAGPAGATGPAGPNEVTTSTSTDITGILKGDGSNVSAAVEDTDYQGVPAEGAFTDGDKTKLDGIESGATADQTGAEIKTAYEAEADTNAYTDAEKTKLAGIETGATADQTAAEVSVDDTNLVSFVGTNVQEIIDFADTGFTNARSTGVRNGGGLTDQGSGVVRIAAGVGGMLDNTDPANPVYTQLSWAQTDIDLSGPDQVHYIYVNTSNVVTSTTTAPTNSDYRTSVWLWRVSIRSNAVVGTLPIPMPLQNYGPQLRDAFVAMGDKKEGLAISAAGSNLTFAYGAGSVYSPGVNFFTDPTNPHHKSISALSPVTFQHVDQDNDRTADTTILDVANYDNGGTLTAIPGSGSRAQIFTVFLSPNSLNVRVLYGQEYFANVAEAFSALQSGEYSPIVPNQILTATNLIGWIIAEKSATALDDGTQVFVTSNRDGTVGGSVATSGANALLAANNLSDLNDAPTARTNLGLGSIATQDASSVAVTGGTVSGITQLEADALIKAYDGNSEAYLGALSGFLGGGLWLGDPSTTLTPSTSNFTILKDVTGLVLSGDGDGIVFSDTSGDRTSASYVATLTDSGLDFETGKTISINSVNVPTVNSTDTLTNKTLDATNTVNIGSLDINGGTDIGADLADADLVAVDDGGGGTIRKSALSRFWTYIKAKIESVALSALEVTGDLTVDTDTLHVDSTTNRVTIGGTSGDASLEVFGGLLDTLKISSATGGVGYVIGRDAGTGLLNFYGPQAGFTGYRFEDQDGSKHLEIETGGNVSIGSGSLTFDANSGTWDGATIAGDQTLSGQIEATGQAASTDDSVMTRSLMDDRMIYSVMHGQYAFELNNTYWAKTTTGSASIANSNQSIILDTGTTTGSTAQANATDASSGNWQLATGDGRGIVDWSKRTAISAKIWVVSATGSDSVIRILVGQAYNETGATDLLSSEKGIGIKILAGDIYAQVANGTAVTNTDTGQNIPNINEIDLTIESDGSGNWTFWVNGAQVASGTGAPTGNSVARDNAVTLSVDNGTSTDNLRLRVTQIKTIQI